MKMRLHSLLWFGIVFCALAIEGAAFTEPDYTVEEWQEEIRKLRGFDEIRMTLAEKTVEVPMKWTEAGAAFESRKMRNVQVHALKVENPERFIELLEFRPGKKEPACDCAGLFDLWFYRNGERVGTLHFAHGHYWAPLTDESQQAINRWLEEKEFPLREILNSDRAKEANQSPQRNAGSRPSSMSPTASEIPSSLGPRG